MKKSLLFFILFVPILSISQVDVGLQFGLNYPINYTSNDIARKLGGEIGIQVIKDYTINFGFESGIIIEAFGRVGSSSDTAIEEASYLKFQLYIPVLATYKFCNDKLVLKSGLMVAFRNILMVTNYPGIDPEITDGSETIPAARNIGLDFNLGLDYQFSKKWGTSLNVRTPFTTQNQNYGVVTLGLNYKIYNQKE